jgi:hypothetical protein
MKNILTFVFIFLNFIACAKQNVSSNPDDLPAHPRLVWLKDEEKIIQKSIETDKNWAAIHQFILEESNKMIELPTLERIQIGRRLLDKSRECLRRVSYLAYSYRMTKDKKYLTRCEAELVKVSQFSDWNPSHFLDVAEMTLAVAIGYDWLYNDLSVDSKKIIKEAILKKGIAPSYDSRYNSWLNASNNWNQVCNAGMVYGALAIQEDNPQTAEEVLKRAETSIKLPLEDYNPDGAYPEGHAYWEYGTSFHVLYLSALKKLNKNIEMNAGFEKSAEFFMNLIGNSGKSFNYSDAGSGTSNLSATVFWFANHTKDNSLLYNQKTYAEAKRFGSNRIFPFAMIWGLGLNLANISEPKSNFWMGQGKSPVAMIRTSWADKNGIFLGFKAGSPNVSHAHMDVGSFVMDALGERWSMDLGMQDYESLESKGVKLWDKSQNGQRWDILRYNNFHHSTLTFDGQFQQLLGNATINSQINKPNFRGVVSDISALYTIGKVNRGVAIMDEKMVVVRDEIETKDKETTLRWTMVTTAKIETSNGASATLKLNGKTLYMKVNSTIPVEIKTWQPVSKIAYDAPNPDIQIVGFEIKIPKNTKQNFDVLLMPSTNYSSVISVPALSDWKN